MKPIVLVLGLTSLVGCATMPAPVTEVSGAYPPISSIAFSRDGSTLWYSAGDARCEVRTLSLADRLERVAFELDWCPSRITEVEGGSVVLTDGVRRGAWKRGDGTGVVDGIVLAASGESNYVVVKEGRVLWVLGSEMRDVGPEGSVRVPSYLRGSDDLLVIAQGVDGERIERVGRDGRKAVSPSFEAIDSFDIAPRGDEMVIAAFRDGSFDVAVAATDGSALNWIPSERGDEVGVAWAPRGNKVSYLIRRADGTLVRTFHVPSSFQLTFETGFEAVRGLAWEPRAERLAMILDGPTFSPHVDWIEYGGANRAALVTARTHLEREPERVVVGSSSALLLPPRMVRYGQKLPLFVLFSDEPLGWSAVVGDLDTFEGGILAISAKDWNELATGTEVFDAMGWVGVDDVVVIAPDVSSSAAVPKLRKGQTLLRTGTKAPKGRFFRESTLPTGGSVVDAESWNGAIAYLRGRFKAK